MVACSVVCTVFILNFHERTVDTHEVGHFELLKHRFFFLKSILKHNDIISNKQINNK